MGDLEVPFRIEETFHAPYTCTPQAPLTPLMFTDQYNNQLLGFFCH